MEIEKDMYSDLSKWGEISNIWHDMSTVSDTFYAGLEAVEKANELLASESIEEIPASTTRDVLDNFDSHRVAIKDFIDNIHYEMDELVDVPFTLSLESALESVYALDPKEFQTVGYGTTLEDMVMSTMDSETISSKELANDFATLDEDKPSTNIKDAIDEARLREEEYQKMSQNQDVYSGS